MLFFIYLYLLYFIAFITKIQHQETREENRRKHAILAWFKGGSL